MVHRKRHAAFSGETGFTLIELLVVIAIIALLTSILLPTLSAVMESARHARCATNLKTLQNGWDVAVEKNGGLTPLTGRAQFDWNGEYPLRWELAIMEGLGAYDMSKPSLLYPRDSDPRTNGFEVGYCPSAPAKYGTARAADGGYSPKAFIHYAINSLWNPGEQAETQIVHGFPYTLDPSSLRQRDTLHSPSTYPLLSDPKIISYRWPGGVWRYQRSEFGESPYMRATGPTSFDSVPHWGIGVIHNGAANAAYADGHVGMIHPDDLTETYRGNPRKLLNH